MSRYVCIAFEAFSAHHELTDLVALKAIIALIGFNGRWLTKCPACRAGNTVAWSVTTDCVPCHVLQQVLKMPRSCRRGRIHSGSGGSQPSGQSFFFLTLLDENKTTAHCHLLHSFWKKITCVSGKKSLANHNIFFCCKKKTWPNIFFCGHAFLHSRVEPWARPVQQTWAPVKKENGCTVKKNRAFSWCRIKRKTGEAAKSFPFTASFFIFFLFFLFPSSLCLMGTTGSFFWVLSVWVSCRIYRIAQTPHAYEATYERASNSFWLFSFVFWSHEIVL